jgi:hypothetical protein
MEDDSRNMSHASASISGIVTGYVRMACMLLGCAGASACLYTCMDVLKFRSFEITCVVFICLYAMRAMLARYPVCSDMSGD